MQHALSGSPRFLRMRLGHMLHATHATPPPSSESQLIISIHHHVKSFNQEKHTKNRTKFKKKTAKPKPPREKTKKIMIPIRTSLLIPFLIFTPRITPHITPRQISLRIESRSPHQKYHSGHRIDHFRIKSNLTRQKQKQTETCFSCSSRALRSASRIRARSATSYADL